MGRLKGKIIVVTGATSGIGLAATKAFVAHEAIVIGVGRSRERVEEAQNAILDDFPKAKLTFFLADLAFQSEVRELAKNIALYVHQINQNHIDVLVNNAGGYHEKKQLTMDGIERTFAVNHLAGFVLTHELMPLLSNAQNGRILTISSYSHFTTPLCLKRITNPWPYISLLAYKRSKLSNILFTYEINRRCKKVTAFAVDPGLVNTAIASKENKGISHLVWRIKRKSGTPPEVPVQTILYLSAENEFDFSQGFYYKDCTPKQPSKKAEREDLARQLWELSCQVGGIDRLNNCF